ncbi:MAG: P-loop NTPase [Desulfobacterales bacterium]|jgi:flagellar biosynthesis protein FlhG
MAEIYPIGGGKGGVGKSFITASLGALIAKWGKRVVLIDLDLGASNLHTLLGMKSPKIGLNSFLNKTVKNLESAAVPTMIPNLFLISSFHCYMEIANLFYAQKLKIIDSIKKLPFDYILLDLGPGTNFNTLDFFLTSKKGILICTPEPTSIENSFRFIKTVYFRKLKQTMKKNTFDSVLKDPSSDLNGSGINPPDIIETVLKHDPGKEAFLRNTLSEFKFKLIFNQFRNNVDATLGTQFENICNRHFYSIFQFLGNIGYDSRIHDAVFSKILYIHKYPHTQSAADLKKIATQMMSNMPSKSFVKDML